MTTTVYLIQMLSLDDLDLVTTAQQDSSPATQVFLPINIAKSAEFKVKEQQGEGHLSLLYADNVFVPINIERSGEVKDDENVGQGQDQTVTCITFIATVLKHEIRICNNFFVVFISLNIY